MPRSILLVVVLLWTTAAYSTSMHAPPPAQAPWQPGLLAFVHSLEQTVNRHAWSRLLQVYIEPNYQRGQHDEILQGHTGQFLYELFFPPETSIADGHPACQAVVHASPVIFWQRLAQIRAFQVTDVADSVVHFQFQYGTTRCVIRHQFQLEHQQQRLFISGAWG